MHLHLYVKSTISKSTCANYHITFTDSGHRIEGTTPAGVVATPYSAEVRAGIAVFDHLTAVSHTGPIRWVLDCSSVISAITSPPKQQTTLIRQLLDSIEQCLSQSRARLDILWVSSHCGLQGNDEADALAKQATQISMTEQLQIPLAYEDTKVRLREKTRPLINLPDLTEVLPNLSKRSAMTTLQQIYTESSPLFAPLRGILRLGDNLCGKCGQVETVRHFFSCSRRRAAQRRAFKTPNRANGWESWIENETLEMLSYLSREGVLVS